MSTAFYVIGYFLIAGLFFCIGALFGFNYWDNTQKPVDKAWNDYKESWNDYKESSEKLIQLQKEQLERYKEMTQLQKEIIAEQGKKV